MNESTARAERYEKRPVVSSPHYLWNAADKPFSVRLSLDVVERLEHEVVEAFRSVTSRGSEIGGLLLGSIADDARPTVTVADYEPVDCDYTRGPLYRLGETDRQRFTAAIARHATSGLAVVGFFRSNTRKGLALDAEDVTFLDEQFDHPLSVTLLVRPFATRACVAGIFIRENSILQAENGALEFPFSRSELLRGDAKLIQPASEAPPATNAAPAPTTADAATPAAKPASRAQIVPIAAWREMAAPSPAPDTTIEAERAKPADPTAPPPKEVVPAKAAAPVQDSAVKEAVPPKSVVQPKNAVSPGGAAQPPESAPANITPQTKNAAPTKPEQPKPAVKPEAPTAVARPPATQDVPSFGGLTASSSGTVEDSRAPAHLGKWIWILAAAALLAILVCLFLYPGLLRHGSRPASTGSAGGSLALRVEHTGTDLLLTWNRDAEAVKTASKAVLIVNDGEQHENVQMDLNQLRNGSIIYSPATTDVSFRLEVTSTDASKSQSESLRVLKTRPSAIPPETPVNGRLGKPDPGKPVDSGTVADVPPNGEALPEEAAQAPVEPKRTPRPFNAPPLESPAARLRAARNTDIPEPPSTEAGAPSLPTSALPQAQVSVPSPVPPPAAAPPSAATPAPAKPAQTNLRTSGRIVAPELVVRREPTYPPLARQARVSGEVMLQVIVGKDGRVKQATALSGHALLRDAAISAVRSWVYKPATVNGDPTEAPVQVKIAFLPNR
jgi:protein TonB